jgi:hypothetical protein
MYINIIHHKKNALENSNHNLNFEVYIQIFKLCDEYYFINNIIHMFKFFNDCWNFQNNSVLKLIEFTLNK